MVTVQAATKTTLVATIAELEQKMEIWIETADAVDARLSQHAMSVGMSMKKKIFLRMVFAKAA